MMNFDQSAYELKGEELTSFDIQVQSSDGETHLIMTNFKSIHVFRVNKIWTKEQVKGIKVNSSFKKTKYLFWIEVDDIFLLDVNHIGDESGLQQRLTEFIDQEQTQNIFRVPHTTLSHKADQGNKFKWVSANRSVTYDYFIRSCELKENIFQDVWDSLSRSTQHFLTVCELQRQQCVFYRDREKWDHLNLALQSYHSSLVSELNEIYILPLVNAIGTFESLHEAWCLIRESLANKHTVKLIDEILDTKTNQINSLDDFLFFTSHAKSLYYSLKNHFSKKFHKEEFLLIENFLGRQDSLINGFQCKELTSTLKLIVKIEEWIKQTNEMAQSVEDSNLKDSNLKLSHLLSIMMSGNYENNIFFKLLEEKMLKGTVQKTFADEVKELSNINLKKVA
ncbi:MAG: hypothetical protein OEW87_10790 [Flavobacteriaceae bacterium]|nr:hypothetical protein [Flavobacteriaceae bacterium]